jgi:MFS family permease
MINILRILFLFFLYFSNVSTILTIYPILYNLIKDTTGGDNWLYFGIIFSVYELGKFFGVPLWDKASYSKSNIALIIISLFLISLLNISFCFTYHLYQIIIIRFFFGFFNYIGIIFKSIYIQMGFKKNNKMIIFLISIISTAFALFLPSITIYMNLGEKIIKIKSIKYKNIMLIYSCLASSNMLALVFCGILICKKKLKINSGFYQMKNNFEKSEVSVEGPIKSQKNNIVELEPNNMKGGNPISDTNINIMNQNKISNDIDMAINKSEKSIDTNNEPNNNMEINNSKRRKKLLQAKELQFSFIQILISLIEGLSLIWTLIILYEQFHEKCLTISFYISILKILGEMILFPINRAITKNSSKLSTSKLILISKKMKIINVILLIISICNSQIIFSLYYYPKYNRILIILLFSTLLIKTIFSGIFTQLFKIYNSKYFQQNNMKNKNLKKYNQYLGSIGRGIIYMLGAFGLLMIELINNRYNATEIIISLVYFQMIPQSMYIILLLIIYTFID